MQGWISLHRKIKESVVWTDPNMLKLWFLCLMKASHKDQPNFTMIGQVIPLKKGEFVTGRDSLAEDFNEGVQKKNRVSAITLWRFLKRFEKLEMLNIKSTNKYSVVSITNWSTYQEDEQQVNNKRTSTEQQVNTKNNVNNANNDNNDNNKTSSSKRKGRIYENDSIYYILAEKLFKQICQNQEIKQPNLNAWADDIRKLIEIDKRTESQVSRMIDWCTTDSFWSTVVLSANKLRAKYQTMAAQANRDVQQKSSYGSKVIRKEPLPDRVENPKIEEEDPEKQAMLQRRLATYLARKEAQEHEGVS